MRPKREFRPQLYAVTQRGKLKPKGFTGDTQDFERRPSQADAQYSTMHRVAVHGYSLLHNHGGIDLRSFDARVDVSDLMRDMQSRHSFYLNRPSNYRIARTPFVLLAPW